MAQLPLTHFILQLGCVVFAVTALTIKRADGRTDRLTIGDSALDVR